MAAEAQQEAAEAEEDDEYRPEAGEDHREAGVMMDIAISPVTSLESGEHCEIISFGSYKENWKEEVT